MLVGGEAECGLGPASPPGVLTSRDAFPGHPPNGQDCSALDAVVIAAVQVAAHAEISNLDGIVLPHQTVACSQVAVYKFERGQVLHSRGNLCRHVLQVTVAGSQKTHMHTDRRTHACAAHTHTHTHTTGTHNMVKLTFSCFNFNVVYIPVILYIHIYIGSTTWLSWLYHIRLNIYADMRNE